MNAKTAPWAAVLFLKQRLSLLRGGAVGAVLAFVVLAVAACNGGAPTPTPRPAGLPDLVVRSISLGLQSGRSCYESGIGDDPLGIAVTIANQGNADASAFTVILGASAVVEVPGLPAGQETTVWFAGSAPGPDGRHSVFVDLGTRIRESNEDNNTASQSFPTRTPPPVCTPTPTSTAGRLTISIVVDPPAPKVGDTVRVTVSASGSGGLPQYRLVIGPGESPALALVANSPERQSRSRFDDPQPVSWELKAVHAGAVTLTISVNYETSIERPEGKVYVFRTDVSDPAKVTVTEP